MSEDRELERVKLLDRWATDIAAEVTGGPPARCQGWKAKVYNAAWHAARAAFDRSDLPPPAQNHDESAIAKARIFAVNALLRRLPRAPLEQRNKLRARIASIRAGILDTAPEVEAAAEALGLNQ